MKKGKPVPFLNSYQYILFDMDGVITSEQRYWDASALAVYQLLFQTKRPMDPQQLTAQVAQVRGHVFCEDQTISLLKEKGVNSNWDLTYVVYATAVMLESGDDFGRVKTYLEQSPYQAIELYEFLGKNSPAGKRGDTLYEKGVACFQEWYLGDALYRKIYQKEPALPGKPGLTQGETPVLPLDTIKSVLSTLHRSGFVLGIGTGRVRYEIEQPFASWELYPYFDPNHLITYSNIQQAEANHPTAVLTKPHPYMFIKGMLGEDFPDEDIINGTYPKEDIPKTLVVGDAGADLLAAQAGGMDFAAVLTGVSGVKAKEYFLENKATYILDSIEQLIMEG